MLEVPDRREHDLALDGVPAMTDDWVFRCVHARVQCVEEVDVRERHGDGNADPGSQIAGAALEQVGAPGSTVVTEFAELADEPQQRSHVMSRDRHAGFPYGAVSS